MKKIYIVLTKTNTLLSNIISFLKIDEYTHASLSLNHLKHLVKIGAA